MKTQIRVKREVDAKILKLHLKVADRFTATLEAADGEELADHDGYVPGFMPGNHYGDYVILDINIETGQILNWKQPTSEQLEEFIRGANKEDDGE